MAVAVTSVEVIETEDGKLKALRHCFDLMTLLKERRTSPTRPSPAGSTAPREAASHSASISLRATRPRV